MSAFVTFPNGTCVEYKRCRQIQWSSSTHIMAELKTTAGGDFIAAVPKDCIVAFEKPDSITPSNVYRGEALSNMLDIVANSIKSIDRTHKNQKNLRLLKETLRDYNIQRHNWK